MDRKNQRAGGAVSTATATSAALTGDDSQDEAEIWKKTLSHFQQLSDAMEGSEGTILALDKIPEGRPNRSATLCQEAADKAREEQEIIQMALESIKNLMALRDGDLANGKHPMVVYW